MRSVRNDEAGATEGPGLRHLSGVRSAVALHQTGLHAEWVQRGVQAQPPSRRQRRTTSIISSAVSLSGTIGSGRTMSASVNDRALSLGPAPARRSAADRRRASSSLRRSTSSCSSRFGVAAIRSLLLEKGHGVWRQVRRVPAEHSEALQSVRRASTRTFPWTSHSRGMPASPHRAPRAPATLGPPSVPRPIRPTRPARR